MKAVNSWSFSSLQQYERCPYAWKLNRVDGLPRPELPPDNPMMRGTRLHGEIEAYIRDGVSIPTSLKYSGDLIERSREFYLEGKAEIEGDWGFDTQWQPVDWQDAWLRAKLDSLLFLDDTTVFIIDWKSGKSWNKEVPHAQQGQLYAACAFQRLPNLQTAKVSFAYIDEKAPDKIKTYTRDQAMIFQISFHNRAVRMLEDTVWSPKPTMMNCKYCDYGKNVGAGLCQYDRYAEEPKNPTTGIYQKNRAHATK